VATTVAAAGLTQQEAERKLAARPPAAAESSRSYKSIVIANVFTVFNLILLAAGVLTLSFGDVQDALFLAILVSAPISPVSVGPKFLTVRMSRPDSPVSGKASWSPSRSR